MNSNIATFGLFSAASTSWPLDSLLAAADACNSAILISTWCCECCILSCANKFAPALVCTVSRADYVDAAVAICSSPMSLPATFSASSRYPISPAPTFSFADKSFNALLAAVSRAFASFTAMRD